MLTRTTSRRFPGSVVFCLGLLTGPVAARAAKGSAAAPEPQGQYARYRMVLTRAGEDGGPLVVDLHARDGKITTGWASVGYEVNMEHPVVAGFLLERNEEGRVVCYELRKGRPWKSIASEGPAGYLGSHDA